MIDKIITADELSSLAYTYVKAIGENTVSARFNGERVILEVI